MERRAVMPETPPLVVPPTAADQPTLVFRRDPTLAPDAARTSDIASAAVERARTRVRTFVSELLENARDEMVHFARANHEAHGRGLVVFPHECLDDLMHTFTPIYTPLRNITAARHGEQARRMVQQYEPLTHVVFFMSLPITLESGAARLLFAPFTIGPFTPPTTPAATSVLTCHNVDCPRERIDTMQQCSRCRARYYCSKECQRADWHAGHKNVCHA